MGRVLDRCEGFAFYESVNDFLGTLNEGLPFWEAARIAGMTQARATSRTVMWARRMRKKQVAYRAETNRPLRSGGDTPTQVERFLDALNQELDEYQAAEAVDLWLTNAYFATVEWAKQVYTASAS